MDRLPNGLPIPVFLDWLHDQGVRPLQLCVSGSHLWGLNTAESDTDVRGIYIDPLRKILSLHPAADTFEAVKAEIAGYEIDLQLYEIGKALRMLGNSNGNIIEQLLAPTMFYTSRQLVDARSLAEGFLTRKLEHYYAGYYHSQRKRAMANRGTKALIYTYCEILAGIWLAHAGEIVYNFHELYNKFSRTFWPLPQLVSCLQRGEWRRPMIASRIWEFEAGWDKLLVLLREEMRASKLPEEPSAEARQKLEDTLLRLRLEEVPDARLSG